MGWKLNIYHMWLAYRLKHEHSAQLYLYITTTTTTTICISSIKTLIYICGNDNDRFCNTSTCDDIMIAVMM